MKRFLIILVLIVMLLTIVGCSAADVASNNVSKAADNFEVNRRVVFYNGITGQYMLVIEGRCSLGNYDVAKELSVTCKIGPDQFKKDFLGLSDNISYFAEQLDPIPLDTYHYRVIIRPEAILPYLELNISGNQQ